jgi:hypothetical protein
VPGQDGYYFLLRPWCVSVPRLVDDVLPEVVHNAPQSLVQAGDLRCVAQHGPDETKRGGVSADASLSDSSAMLFLIMNAVTLIQIGLICSRACEVDVGMVDLVECRSA